MSSEQPNIDPIWHVQIFVILALALQLLLPDRLVAGPRYILPILEIILLALVVSTTPRTRVFRSMMRKINAVTLVALVSLANIYSLIRVAQDLLAGGRISNGEQLILASLNIYITNIIIFALWYWEIDAGGPGSRLTMQPYDHDFLFPQMTAPEYSMKNWFPTFFDYLYLSSTNATAFSPTDTLPLTRRVKLLMLIQAIVSLITIALVAARAVNILS